MKKALSIILILALTASFAVISANAASAAGACIVTGSDAALFGAAWDNADTDNAMEPLYENGTVYKKTYTVNRSFSDIQLRVFDPETNEWYGDETGNNLSFEITEPGAFTVYYSKVSHTVKVSGDNVNDWSCTDWWWDPFFVYGNGDEGWLNGAADNAVSLANEMEEPEDMLYCISLNASAGEGRELRFSYCGGTDFFFGGSFDGLNKWSDAVFYGDAITLDTEDAIYDVFFDMRGFDFASKEGARFAIVKRTDGEAFHYPENGRAGQKHLPEFKKQLQQTYGACAVSDYEELYDENSCGFTAWTLVRAQTDLPCEDDPCFGVFGNRVLTGSAVHSPFAFDYGVYDAWSNTFVPLEQAYHNADYTGLAAVLDALGVGIPLGDTDGDGKLTVNDATELQRVLADFCPMPADSTFSGVDLTAEPADYSITEIDLLDVNCDGTVNIGDATAIQRLLAEFEKVV